MKKIFISTLIITPLLSAFGWFFYDSYQKRAEEAKADANPRWEIFAEIKESKDSFYVYLPVRKDQENSLLRSTWTKIIKSDGSYTVAFQEFDCKNKSYKNRYFRAYDLGGKVINSLEGSENWMPIAPDTISEQALLKVCR